MINFIVWLIAGAVVGWVARQIMHNQSGLLLNILLGIVGAFVAGLVVTPLLGIATINQNDFSLPALLVSLAGAVVVLFVLGMFRRSAMAH
jgi:uncharacterized membrane protein YeaQ/YmgE (transglycosylase-associated protein family)